MGKKSAAKKKAAKRATATDSESQQIADDATEASEAVEESLPLDAIEAASGSFSETTFWPVPAPQPVTAQGVVVMAGFIG